MMNIFDIGDIVKYTASNHIGHFLILDTQPDNQYNVLWLESGATNSYKIWQVQVPEKFIKVA